MINSLTVIFPPYNSIFSVTQQSASNYHRFLFPFFFFFFKLLPTSLYPISSSLTLFNEHERSYFLFLLLIIVQQPLTIVLPWIFTSSESLQKALTLETPSVSVSSQQTSTEFCHVKRHLYVTANEQYFKEHLALPVWTSVSFPVRIFSFLIRRFVKKIQRQIHNQRRVEIHTACGR